MVVRSFTGFAGLAFIAWPCIFDVFTDFAAAAFIGPLFTLFIASRFDGAPVLFPEYSSTCDGGSMFVGGGRLDSGDLPLLPSWFWRTWLLLQYWLPGPLLFERIAYERMLYEDQSAILEQTKSHGDV